MATEKKKKKTSSADDELQAYVKRCKKATPPFFKKLRLAGIIIAAVGTSVLAAPIALPAVVTAVAGYLATAGAVATAVSQAAVKEEEDCEEE